VSIYFPKSDEPIGRQEDSFVRVVQIRPRVDGNCVDGYVHSFPVPSIPESHFKNAQPRPSFVPVDSGRYRLELSTCLTATVRRNHQGYSHCLPAPFLVDRRNVRPGNCPTNV